MKVETKTTTKNNRNNAIESVVKSDLTLIKAYDIKLGSGDIAYRMTTDKIKALASTEDEAGKYIDFFAESLKDLGLFKISRVTFNNKELLKAWFDSELLKLSETKESPIEIDREHRATFPNAKPRFVVINPSTNSKHKIGLNISLLGK